MSYSLHSELRWRLHLAELNIRHGISRAAGDAKREIQYLAACARIKARTGLTVV